MNPSARLYNCARCHCLVMICRHCDRGNIYCPDCPKAARAESLLRAQKKYQASRSGRFKNAERQRRSRERKREKVTHQGSAPIDQDDLLSTEPSKPDNILPPGPFDHGRVIHCHFCCCECDPFIRRYFLRRSGHVRHRSSR